SPGRIRMKFIRILPEMCARIVWPLSNWTRNMAFGSVSATVPCASITSSLAIALVTPSIYNFVRIRGPASVTTIVCSKWADRLPSRVTAVQPSASSLVSGRPMYQASRLVRDGADRNCNGGISIISVHDDPDVQSHDVALFEHAVRRNTVHDLFVDRHT